MYTIGIVALGAVFFIILDLIWFSVAGNFFKAEIGSIARLHPDGSWNVRMVPAFLVYLLMSVGIYVFVTAHAEGVLSAVLLGGLFGLVGYGLYDLTNLATLSDWTVRFVVVDMVWGTVLCGAVSGVVYMLAKAIA